MNKKEAGLNTGFFLLTIKIKRIKNYFNKKVI